MICWPNPVKPKLGKLSGILSTPKKGLPTETVSTSYHSKFQLGKFIVLHLGVLSYTLLGPLTKLDPYFLRFGLVKTYLTLVCCNKFLESSIF